MEISLSAFFIYKNHCQMSLDLRSNPSGNRVGHRFKKGCRINFSFCDEDRCTKVNLKLLSKRLTKKLNFITFVKLLIVLLLYKFKCFEITRY